MRVTVRECVTKHRRVSVRESECESEGEKESECESESEGRESELESASERARGSMMGESIGLHGRKVRGGREVECAGRTGGGGEREKPAESCVDGSSKRSWERASAAQGAPLNTALHTHTALCAFVTYRADRKSVV